MTSQKKTPAKKTTTRKSLSSASSTRKTTSTRSTKPKATVKPEAAPDPVKLPDPPESPHLPPSADGGQDDLSRAVSIVGQYVIGAAIAAGVLLLLGQILFGDGFLGWVIRLVALGVFFFGATLWRQRIKIVYLEGEEDIWYGLYSWNKRLIGFVPAGVLRIRPLQTFYKWRQITPIFIRQDVTARNKLHDRFNVHVRVRYNLHPEVPLWADARWLMAQYPEGIVNTTKSIVSDVVTAALKQIGSFSLVIEETTETELKEAINAKLGFLSAKGVEIDPYATFVDIMVPDEIMQQQVKTRAEFTTLQVIREIAHDMGMTTDELLLQRALEQMPVSRGQKSHREIVAVLQMLRNERMQELRNAGIHVDTPPPMQIPAHTPSPDDENVLMVDDVIIVEPPQEDEPVIPRGYVEGIYEPIDNNDPDGEDNQPRGIYSPF